MSWLTSQIIPALQTIKLIGNVDAFTLWLRAVYPEIKQEKLFEGYRFSINCCLNSFVDGLSGDQLLGVENDFLLNRAIRENIPIHHIENSCDKTILLKNIKPYIKAIIKSNSYDELNTQLKEFNTEITSIFDYILNNNIYISPEIKIKKETAIKLLLIGYTKTFLIQINNNGPFANSLNPLSTSWTKNERKEYYFDGYKYAIQFLWHQLLGEAEFNKTHLKNIHLADSWRTYNYIEKDKSEDPKFDFLNQRFKLEEQTCFDSYLYWIIREVTDPLLSKYKIQTHSIDSHFQFSLENYKKELFDNLLDKNKINESNNLTWEDKIRKCLYWYSFEIVNSRETQMHYGIPSFNTMLAGTVTLHKPKESEFSRTIVVKFTHPHKDIKKNDYSYGVLIDTKSAAGHYSSGWVIYQDACGDYSGLSGSQYKSSEKLIAKYLRTAKIELRELTIPLKDFEAFTNQYTKGHEQLSILEQNKLIPDIIQKSKALLFELFTYYVCSKSPFYNDYEVKLSVDKKGINNGEKDVVLIKENEVILIECKLNPQSYDIEKLIKKQEEKINTFPQLKKSYQFWFWEKLSIENKQILEQAKIAGNKLSYIEVSNFDEYDILRGVDLKQLKFIMQDYNRNNREDFTYDLHYINS